MASSTTRRLEGPVGQRVMSSTHSDKTARPVALDPVALNGARVVAQLGQSLDGRVAAASGESRYINGAGGLNHLHGLRASVDAVLVGVGTILADDPRLTVRHLEAPNPARVIIDPSGRMPADARCLADDGAPVVVIGRRRPDLGTRAHFLDVPHPGRVMKPEDVVRALADLGFERLLIEGGPTTIAHFLKADAIDSLHLLVAPIILGAGPAGLDMPFLHRLDQALRPMTRVRPLDDGDVLFECDFRAGMSSCARDRAETIQDLELADGGKG